MNNITTTLKSTTNPGQPQFQSPSLYAHRKRTREYSTCQVLDLGFPTLLAAILYLSVIVVLFISTCPGQRSPILSDHI